MAPSPRSLRSLRFEVFPAGLGLLLAGAGANLFAAPEARPPATVFVQKLTTEALYDRLSYPARIQSEVNADVLSEFDGIVRAATSGLGQKVKRGSVLFRIENTDPIYRYAPASITAPIGGVVASVDVTVGSRVTRGQKLASITDPKKIRIVAEVPASDLNALTPDMAGELVLSASRTEAKVRLSGKSPFVDPATGTATVEMKIDDPRAGARFAPGEVGKVSFRAREHQGLQIPEHAVVYRGAAPYVRVIENNKAKYVPVVLGELRNGSIEVVKGLTPQMEMIVRSSTYVSEGEAVRVESLDAKSEEAPKRGEG